MNQILYIKEHTQTPKNKNTPKKNIFKIQFFTSCALILSTIIGYCIYSFNIDRKENLSKKLLSNYNISMLYNDEDLNSNNTYEDNGTIFSIIGIIEIPTISICYPILSEYNDDLLKIAPCRISGPMPNENGNLCIAGHNYDNYKFFSQIYTLNNNDKIILYDTNGNSLVYYVYSIYEVDANNLSPLEMSSNCTKQLTLITCNNINSKRIVVTAIPK